MKKLFILWVVLISFYANAQETTKMKPLFNGKNLKGWYTFLSTKGKDNDPEKVFSVENGLLHISGKEFGYMCTKNIYTNFHLAVEFKWGIKKYPPRDADTTKRDNGICYYISKEAKDTVWPRSIECQIQEGDVGDFWLIGGTTIKVDGVRSPSAPYTRLQKKADAERPTGEWNRVEVIANKGKITYIVNGKVVNEGEEPSLSEGKILIQSEGAEIYYRKIEIAKLN
ncbi:MAG: DUF1080 domain-containing protein [Bacteroidia bacterium]|nr:DUF1080 domain-containing protein [Bacteroidia bacterium]